MRRVGLDLDGVIRDFIGKLNKCYDRDFPGESRSEVVRTWGLEDSYSIGKAIYQYAFHDNAKEIYSEAEPYPLSIHFANWLNDNYELHIITSQPNRFCFKGTSLWLLKHLPNIRNIHFTSLKYTVNVDLLIDDYHKNLEEFREHGGISVCIDRPWNQQWDGDRGATYEDIKDIVRHYLA